ncbi:hypothetical protein As57867_007590, partial [Aphanomyces stellatus]
MRTFKEKLALHMIPEWEEHYVNYVQLKVHVKKIQRRAIYLELVNPHGPTETIRLLSPPTPFEREFTAECNKVQAWYMNQLDECRQQWVRLQDQHAATLAAHAHLLPSPTNGVRRNSVL